MKEVLLEELKMIVNKLEEISSELLKISDKHVFTVILINDVQLAFRQIKKEIERI